MGDPLNPTQGHDSVAPMTVGVPGFDGYEAAIINFRFLASDLWSTGEAAERLAELK